MISTNDVKPGMALDLPEGLFQIIDYQHVKPGKGKAFVRMKLRNLQGGAVVDRTFRADENVPRAIIDRSDFQYLYRDDMGYHFMNTVTYEQLAVPIDIIAEDADYISDGMVIRLSLYDGNPIGVELPASVELKVIHAEPGVKGDRVSGATKQVTLETNLKIQVPLFIEEEDVVKVDTRTRTYITRAS